MKFRGLLESNEDVTKMSSQEMSVFYLKKHNGDDEKAIREIESEMKNTKGDPTLSMARTRMADAISIIKKRPKSLADLDIELYRVKTGRYVYYRLTDKLYPKHVSEFNSKPTLKEIADFVKEREKRVSHHVKF